MCPAQRKRLRIAKLMETQSTIRTAPQSETAADQGACAAKDQKLQLPTRLTPWHPTFSWRHAPRIKVARRHQAKEDLDMAVRKAMALKRQRQRDADVEQPRPIGSCPMRVFRVSTPGRPKLVAGAASG